MAASCSLRVDPQEPTRAGTAADVLLATNRNAAKLSSTFHRAGPITTADMCERLSLREAVARAVRTRARRAEPVCSRRREGPTSWSRRSDGHAHPDMTSEALGAPASCRLPRDLGTTLRITARWRGLPAGSIGNFGSAAVGSRSSKKTLPVGTASGPGDSGSSRKAARSLPFVGSTEGYDGRPTPLGLVPVDPVSEPSGHKVLIVRRAPEGALLGLHTESATRSTAMSTRGPSVSGHQASQRPNTSDRRCCDDGSFARTSFSYPSSMLECRVSYPSGAQDPRVDGHAAAARREATRHSAYVTDDHHEQPDSESAGA